MRALLTSLIVAFLCLFSKQLLAADECVGPAECCIMSASAVTAPLPTHVRLGMRILRIQQIAEQEGSYSGEMTLLFRWAPGGLRPQLDPRNGVEVTTPLDETKLFEGSCYREQRMVGKFQSWFRLRRFPFDAQELRLNLEDRRTSDETEIYEPELWPTTISVDAFRELSAWRVADYPRIEELHRSTFAFPMNDRHPRLILIHTKVERQWQFYLTRFFLPLFLLVALAYAIFWIKPEDLSSSSAIGVTSMLAIIAFQLSMADTLPHVPYLTIADRIYTVCYILIAVALGFAVFEAYLVDKGKKEAAERYDRKGRLWFPIAFVVLIASSGALGWYKNASPDADTQKLPKPNPPAGEH